MGSAASWRPYAASRSLPVTERTQPRTVCSPGRACRASVHCTTGSPNSASAACRPSTSVKAASSSRSGESAEVQRSVRDHRARSRAPVPSGAGSRGPVGRSANWPSHGAGCGTARTGTGAGAVHPQCRATSSRLSRWMLCASNTARSKVQCTVEPLTRTSNRGHRPNGRPSPVSSSVQAASSASTGIRQVPSPRGIVHNEPSCRMTVRIASYASTISVSAASSRSGTSSGTSNDRLIRAPCQGSPSPPRSAT